jgi:hypothetical protein
MEEVAERAFDATDGLALTDIILPSQYFGAMVGGGGLCGEQRLMLAVLVDAINILQVWHRFRPVRKRLAFAEAAQWVNTRATSCTFSFDSICDALGIDREILRQRLSGLTMGNNALALEWRGLRLPVSNRAQRITANRVRRGLFRSRLIQRLHRTRT